MTNEEIFAARIARINAGAANTKGTIFIGQDEQLHFGRREAVRQSKSREITGNAAYPLSLIGAFGLGLCAVALATYARFHLMAGQAELEDADLEMALSGVIGLALSFVLAQMLRLTSKEHKAMQGAGVFVMVCAFHNFAHWAPGPMALAFSPAYVAQIQTAAPPIPPDSGESTSRSSIATAPWPKRLAPRQPRRLRPTPARPSPPPQRPPAPMHNRR